MDQTIKILFGSITQDQLSLPKCGCYFSIPWTIYFIKCIFSFFQKDVFNFDIEYKTCYFFFFGGGGVGGTVPQGICMERDIDLFVYLLSKIS